jgi:hypothetical protein
VPQLSTWSRHELIIDYYHIWTWITFRAAAFHVAVFDEAFSLPGYVKPASGGLQDSASLAFHHSLVPRDINTPRPTALQAEGNRSSSISSWRVGTFTFTRFFQVFESPQWG